MESKLFDATVIKLSTKRLNHATLFKVCFKINQADDQPEEIIFGTQLVSDRDSFANIRLLKLHQSVKARLDYSFVTPRIVQLVLPKTKKRRLSSRELDRLFWFNAQKDREYQLRLAQH